MKAARLVARTPQSLIETGIVFKDETWSAFALRINLPAFTSLSEFIGDTFLNGPVANQPAAIVLNTRIVYMPSYVKSILLGLGINGDTLLPISNQLRSLLASPFPGTSFVINEGYQTFFDRLVEIEGIEVCLGCGVTNVKVRNEVAGGGVSVWTKETSKQDFDFVIIASRPHDSLGFLQIPSDLRNLVSAASDFDPVFTFAFRAESTPAALEASFAALIYPVSSDFSTAAGTINGIGKDFPDLDVCVAIAYADAEASDEQAINKALEDLKKYQFAVSEVISYQKYPYVSIPPAEEVANDWLTKMDDLQGVDNIYTIGEALSGYGVPAALNFVNDFYSKYFAED